MCWYGNLYNFGAGTTYWNFKKDIFMPVCIDDEYFLKLLFGFKYNLWSELLK